MTSIFISYSRSDEVFARKLATALSHLGADIWIDIEDIPAGMKWSTAIQQGLDTADAMVVIISPESMASRNVEDEWQYLLDQNKPVIPVLLRQAKVHFQLNRIQWVDFLNQPFPAAMLLLHAELKRNGIRLLEPPPLEQDMPPLTRAHSQLPTTESTSVGREKQTNSMLLYAGGLIAIVAIVALVGFLILSNNGNNNNAAATIAAQETGFADLERATQSFQETLAAQETRFAASETATAQVQATHTEPPTQVNLGPITHNADWQPIERTIGGVKMVLVPSGSFTRGTTQEHFDANFAVCLPRLGSDDCQTLLEDEFFGEPITMSDPYWIDRYEVSEQVYGSGGGNAPQVNITSQEAQNHCAARNASLPTEIQWEYAAKGPDGWRYPWGNEWDLTQQRANICDSNCSQAWAETRYDDGYEQSASVVEFNQSASWVGAINMVGNVWEWTADRYDTTNTLRGGGWTWIQGEATTTSRANGIAARTDFYGFRCVLPYNDGDLERYGE